MTAGARPEPRWGRPAAQRYGRLLASMASGAGLWAAIAGFVVWAAASERDALVIGVVSGSIFALGATGLTLIYGILKFGHFAHGDSMMLSAYVAFFLLTGVVVGERPAVERHVLPVNISDLPGATDALWRFSFGYGLLLAMALSAVVAMGVLVLTDRLVYRPLRRRKSGIVIFSIASLGVAIALRSLVLLLWGPTPRFYVPGIRERVHLFWDVNVLADQIFIFGAAVSVAAATYWLLFRTRSGKAMRAMADNPDLARISGIDTEWITVLTWAMAGALVAVAGVLLALQAQLDPELGFILLLPLFASAILGGIGSPQGALVGGMVVGITQEVAVTFDPISPGYKFSVAFVILILILLVKPRGLFGGKL